MRYVLSLLITVLFLLFPFISGFAEETDLEYIKINPYGGEEDAIDTISWYASDDRYFIFLPSDTVLSTARVYYSASDDLSVDGKIMSSGDIASAFDEGTHIITCTDTKYTVVVYFSANIPTVFISTESGSMDYIHANKDNKESGSIRVYENGEMKLDNAFKHIKGRGNASWGGEKKSYNIKFTDKTNMLGMGSAKKYTLIANYFDESLLRNIYAREFAKALGLHYTLDYRFVDLYINGNYYGNYVISESMEIDNERINIYDLEKANEKVNMKTDLESFPQIGTRSDGTVLAGTEKASAKWIDMPKSPNNITGGYLLEYDYPSRYDLEQCGFVTDNGQPVVIKSPELASESEVRYIWTFVNDATNALYSESGYNEKGKHYSDYFDLDSFVNMYILQELSSNIDAGFSSMFLYKEQNRDKLIMSPVWDFDHAFGDEIIRFGDNAGDPNVWWANSLGYYDGYPIYTVFNAAFRHSDFKTAVRNRWEQLVTEGVFDEVITIVHAMSESVNASGTMNIIRWNNLAAINPSSAEEMYAEKVAVGERFIQQRCVALSKGFSEDVAMLYYDANGGSGHLVSPTIAMIGESITVRDRDGDWISPPGEEYEFIGWNTASNGTGKMYHPDDQIVLANAITTLYATWKLNAKAE